MKIFMFQTANGSLCTRIKMKKKLNRTKEFNIFLYSHLNASKSEREMEWGKKKTQIHVTINFLNRRFLYFRALFFLYFYLSSILL
jgi:hypothetical protein